ncbi:MAG: type II toxin-antitoxin system YafQ family toxin [Gammaproteobacteria bacterium]|nr:type II toxin-antitoxin system YafQ family toxin [Gammaproteobacteria bacterium]
MLTATYTKKFKQDIERVKKRGKNLNGLKDILDKLLNQDKLPTKNKDHSLKGVYKDCRECHIEPDWLLIYKVITPELMLYRTGTHSDLF